MTVQRFRYDKVEKQVIPLSEWNEKYGEKKRNASWYAIEDIKPYIAVTGDMQGKVISGRKAHRDFLRRNKLVEVGDEKSYMTKNGGMTDDNPNLKSDKQYEDEVCRSLMTNLNRLKSR